MKQLMKIFNILPDQNQKYILIFALIIGLVDAYSFPAIQKLIITDLPAQWISIQIIAGAGMQLLVGAFWKGKTREVAAKNFILLTAAESITGFAISIYIVFVDMNIWVLAIAQLTYTMLITTFISKCIMMFKSKLWNDRGREIYDNNQQQTKGIVLLIGAFISLVAMPSPKVAILIFGTSCLIDNIGWIIVYIRNRKVLTESHLDK